MKIKKLEVIGFKSFVDRTVVHFDHDVTGIVGPNGCGKSNVVDAIKWVMGEQSAKSLRGHAMNDVIFNGSEVRGPAQFSEVTLTFDNSDGLAPIEYRDYAELAVSRRLDRKGQSDYFINKTHVRLMDITNLFLGTGVGRRAYSIIEQGRVGSIVTSKAEDRRQMIEEAAGITKFKVRKKAAEKKMEQTRENLTRVEDIIRELDKNLLNLKRQAQKAERYKEYRGEQKDLELWVGSFRYLEALTELQFVSQTLDVEIAKMEGAKFALSIREAETETERLELERVSHEVERAQAVSYALENEVRLLESQLAQQKERVVSFLEREQRAELEVRELEQQFRDLRDEQSSMASMVDSLQDLEEEAAEHLDRELEVLSMKRRSVEEAQHQVNALRQKATELQNQVTRSDAQMIALRYRRDESEQRLERLKLEHEGIEEDLLQSENQRIDAEGRFETLQELRDINVEKRTLCENELASVKETLDALEQIVNVLREDVTQRKSRLRSLTELSSRYDGVGTGTRTLMTEYAPDEAKRSEKGIQGLLLDHIDCDEKYARVLSAVLGERLQYLVVEEIEQGLEAIRYLQAGKKGRTGLLPRRNAISFTELTSPDFDGVIGPLLKLVKVSAQDHDLVSRLLSKVIVVDNIEIGVAARDKFPEFTFVTLSGELMTHEGILQGGTADDANEHMLHVKHEMRELELVVKDLEMRFEEELSKQSELRARIDEINATRDTLRLSAHEAEVAVVVAEKDLRRAEEEVVRVRNRIERIAEEIDDIQAMRTNIDNEQGALSSTIEQSRHNERIIVEQLKEGEALLDDLREAVEIQNERVTEVKLRATQARERLQSDKSTLERVSRNLQELEQREQKLRVEMISFVQQQGRIYGEMFVQKESLHLQIASVKHAQNILSDLRSHYDAIKNAASVNETDLRTIRVQIEEQSQKMNERTLRKRELTMMMGHLSDTIRDRYEVDLPRILGDYHQREIPDPAVLHRIDELTKLIQRMGDINLLAIEEYDEQSKRFEYLSSQKADLLDALGQLERAIRQMNRESRNLFKDAFDGINQRFQLIFPRLFRGGEAKLALTNPDDLLESGVDIIAQPPGKKLGSLELMSGGEKALTAVAMIFAIFQYKPSPFCILDEVDAPLDEANVTRFADAIRQMTDRSQFIVITHSKRTMESADVLYGVTMEQPGISKLIAVELRGQRKAQHEPRLAVA